MAKKTSPVTKGHAAGRSGQQIGLENEKSLLGCINDQGWVRENEASLLTGITPYMVGQVSRRLEERGWICRERKHGNAGFFLRLTAKGAKEVHGKSGKDVSIPDCWRHHALAIQTLNYLAELLQCEIETEASMRRRLRTGKFPDGRLVKDGQLFFFEQEMSRKSGPNLRKQVETIVQLANRGFTCHVAYPYPSTVCDGIDHEVRLTNAIRHKWGSPSAVNIKLVRCHFNSLLQFHNVHASRFEIIDLPPMFNTHASRKSQTGITHQERGFQWQKHETRILSLPGQPIRIEARLYHNGTAQFECAFIQGINIDDPHILEVNGSVAEESYDEEQSIHDFMLQQMKIIEKRIEEGMR